MCLNLPEQGYLSLNDHDPTESMVELLVECYGNNRDIMEDDLAENQGSQTTGGGFLCFIDDDAAIRLGLLPPGHLARAWYRYVFDIKNWVLSVVSPPPDGLVV